MKTLRWVLLAGVLLWLLTRVRPTRDTASPPGPPTDAPRMTVGIRPQVPEPPEVVPPESPPQSPPQPEAAPAAVEPAPHAASDAALPGGHPGDVPVFADYQRYLGFEGYVRAMMAQGGVFLLYDAQGRRLLREVNPLTGGLREVEPDLHRGMGPRVREIPPEHTWARILRESRARFDTSDVRLILLMPAAFDNAISEALRREAAAHGLAPESLLGAEGVYRQHQGRVVLQIHRLRGPEGAIPTDLQFGL